MSLEKGPYPDLRDLACEIGQVQIFWSFLESAVRSQLIAVGMTQESAGPQLIHHWRKYLRQLAQPTEDCLMSAYLSKLDIASQSRNLLAHGILSVSADPWDAKSAFAICADREGGQHIFTLEAIRSLAQEIDYLRLKTRSIAPPANCNSV